MPRFWNDVAQGRWTNVVQKLRDFGDRYPTRRNAEADLLQRAIDRGALIAFKAQRDYTVQPGDTLSEIAVRLGASTEELGLDNGITDYDTIYSGQVLYY
jgi:nucleoid-associated protein YgaU